jgi:hypothetical protein
MVFIPIFRYIIKTIENMANRLRGNLTVWGVILMVFALPMLVLGVIFELKEMGWFWGIVTVLLTLYIINFVFPFF